MRQKWLTPISCDLLSVEKTGWRPRGAKRGKEVERGAKRSYPRDRELLGNATRRIGRGKESGEKKEENEGLLSRLAEDGRRPIKKTVKHRYLSFFKKSEALKGEGEKGKITAERGERV